MSYRIPWLYFGEGCSPFADRLVARGRRCAARSATAHRPRCGCSELSSEPIYDSRLRGDPPSHRRTDGTPEHLKQPRGPGRSCKSLSAKGPASWPGSIRCVHEPGWEPKAPDKQTGVLFPQAMARSVRLSRTQCSRWKPLGRGRGVLDGDPIVSERRWTRKKGIEQRQPGPTGMVFAL
jgi:hypothetical protein